MIYGGLAAKRKSLITENLTISIVQTHLTIRDWLQHQSIRMTFKINTIGYTNPLAINLAVVVVLACKSVIMLQDLFQTLVLDFFPCPIL